MNKIIVNENEYQCTENDLPLLIHGEDKAGASLFTITFAANLFSKGSKLLFLSGYKMAKEEFFKQVNLSSGEENNNIFFCLKDEVKNFSNYINTSPDINDRVIFIKNIELFDEKIFDLISTKKFAISGDVNKCVFKDKILNIIFKTKILFSELGNIETPKLEKYHGFFVNTNIKGITTLKII